MSCPAFAWALERGATLKLLASDRLVLIYLADMANGELVCWPGQPRIERFTGLKNNTVRAAIRRLADAQLIRVENTPGRVARYHILRPLTPANGAGVGASDPLKSDGGTPANQTRVTPANGAGVPPQNRGGYPLNRDPGPPQMGPPTPANGTPDPSSTQERDPRARVPAREAGKADSDSEQGKEGKEGRDPFNGWVERVSTQKLHGAKAVGLLIEGEALSGEVSAPDDAVGTKAVLGVVRGVGRELRHFALVGRPPQRDKWDQIAENLAGGPLRTPQPQDPVRTPAEQLAALLGISLAEAEARVPAAAA